MGEVMIVPPAKMRTLVPGGVRAVAKVRMVVGFMRTAIVGRTDSTDNGTAFLAVVPFHTKNSGNTNGDTVKLNPCCEANCIGN